MRIFMELDDKLYEHKVAEQCCKNCDLNHTDYCYKYCATSGMLAHCVNAWPNKGEAGYWKEVKV